MQNKEACEDHTEKPPHIGPRRGDGHVGRHRMQFSLGVAKPFGARGWRGGGVALQLSFARSHLSTPGTVRRDTVGWEREKKKVRHVLCFGRGSDTWCMG